MPCPDCGSSTISFSVPDEYREHAPATAVACCTRCLTLSPESGAGSSDAPDFSRLSDAFPARPARAIPLALAIGLCSSLATNRDAIETLLRDAERAGVDPLLVLDRLAADPSIEPAIDLERRRHQLEQLLY
jgi:hypothetical protein